MKELVAYAVEVGVAGGVLFWGLETELIAIGFMLALPLRRNKQ